MLGSLTVLSGFCTFNSVPQNRTILEFLWSIIWQENFLMDDFVLPAIIVSYSVILIFDFFTRYVCSFSNCTCAFASAYHLDIKMINCDNISPFLFQIFNLSFPLVSPSITQKLTLCFCPFISTYKKPQKSYPFQNKLTINLPIRQIKGADIVENVL